MTDFTMVSLKHSVRAASDKKLQEIQNITRMNPEKLIGNAYLERRFKDLMRENVNFVKSMQDERLGPSVQRMYSTRKSACEQADDYVGSCIKQLEKEDKPFMVCNARDFQRTASSRAELRETYNEEIQSALDRKVREPRRLAFFEGAIFEATVNEDNFSQSQVMVMTTLPSKEQFDNRWDISLLAAPPEYKASLINKETLDESELLRKGWTRVKISLTPERLITTNGIEAYRSQFTLRHLGASTINKQQVRRISVQVNLSNMLWLN